MLEHVISNICTLGRLAVFKIQEGTVDHISSPQVTMKQIAHVLPCAMRGFIKMMAKIEKKVEER
jgi:hypothetical protein